MENASKALIIAGAILISILLISMGIVLINSGEGVLDSQRKQMSAMELQIFNGQFTGYEGEKKTAAMVRELYSKVQTSNQNYEDYQVTMIQPTATTVTNAKKYTITLTYDDGVVTDIKYTEST